MNAAKHGLKPMTYGHGVSLVLAAGVLWSLMGLGVRAIHDASAFQIVLYRSLGVLPGLFILLAAQSGGAPLRVIAKAGWPSVIGGLSLVVAFMGSIISLKATSVANAAFLWATSPLYAAILGRVILGEPVRVTTWISILVAAIGVAMMVYEGISVGHLYGNAAALICAMGFACFTIALRWDTSGNSLPATLYGGIFCAIAATATTLVAGQSLLIPSQDAIIALLLGAVALSGGLVLYTIGARVVPAAELPLLTLNEVVLGPIWVYLAFGERVGSLTLVGGAIVLFALFISAIGGLWLERRDAPAPRIAT